MKNLLCLSQDTDSIGKYSQVGVPIKYEEGSQQITKLIQGNGQNQKLD